MKHLTALRTIKGLADELALAKAQVAVLLEDKERLTTSLAQARADRDHAAEAAVRTTEHLGHSIRTAYTTVSYLENAEAECMRLGCTPLPRRRHQRQITFLDLMRERAVRS